MSNSGSKGKIGIRNLIQKTMKINKTIKKDGFVRCKGIFCHNPVCGCWTRVELRKLKEKIINEHNLRNIRIVSEIIKISRENKKEDDLLEIEHKLRTVDLADRNEVQDEQPDDVVKKGDGMNMDMVE
ncbi:GL21012 [Drosophila persimilis]|uniref:GL21012 n=1 Tax=Drosophila persimilis TaxID=7234 RepID=B4IRH0_DROPE|nr:GL21012 [Drosophila persimilis]